MTAIQYAFRDDPLNVYMLTEGATESSKHAQIITFRKREIAIDFLGDFYFLDSRPPRTTGLTPLGKQIKEKNWSNPYCYLAKVDCQIEFIVRKSIFEHLQETYYPLWTPDVLMSFYEDQPSGFITLLRIFRTEEKLDPKLLQKGRLGSSQILRLYDEFEENARVDVDKLDPILNNSRFADIKAELLYTLKKENALIAIYENSPEGNEKLSAHIDAMRAMLPTQKRSYYDTDSEVDRAQIDYSKVYSEIKQIAPTMSSFVKYVSKIRPAQPGEMDHLIEAAKRNDPIARTRILEMNMRSALKYGLSIHKRYHVDLQDAIQEAIIGLITALDKYDTTLESKFGTYAGLWMRNIITRDLPIGEYVARLPVHMLEKFLPLIEVLEQHECIHCSSGKFCDDMIQRAQEILGCPLEKALDYLNLLIPPLSTKELLVRKEELTDERHFEDKMIEDLDKKCLPGVVDAVLSTLTERERDVIHKRFGFTSRPMTLEAIGKDYKVTRERIRQIEIKAMRKLHHEKRSKKLKPYW